MGNINNKQLTKSTKASSNRISGVGMMCLNPSRPTNKNGVFNTESTVFLIHPKSVAVGVAKYPFKLARLIHYNYDLTKRWYVIFYAWHITKEKLVRVRLFEPINRQKTHKGRMDVARDVIATVNEDLLDGKCLGKDDPTDTTAHNLRTLSLSQALEYIEAQKKLNRLRKGSLKRYKTFRDLFKNYYAWRGMDELMLKQITPDVMADFFGWLQTERKIANKTFNNYRGDLNTFFRWCIKRDPRVLKVNPIDGIDKLKTVTTKHAALSDEQMKLIKAKCIELKYDNLLLFIQFIYNTFARPIELRQLLIRHIEMNDNRIFIPGTISKNSFDEYIPISPELRKAINDSGMLALPGDWYIFGFAGRPGLKTCGIDYFYGKNSEVLRALNITGRAYTVYSYKHSGVISLYRACKDIKLVQRVCRHRTLEQTNTYLRDLGLQSDYEMLEFWK